MLGVIVIVAVSWAILWLITREQITVLGIKPNVRRLKEFWAGFLFMATACATNLLGQSYFQEITYSINLDYGLIEALHGIWWTIKAVLFEELVFRGVILYVLIRKIGVIKACLLDGLAFGIYHWFSYDMFGGRIVPMIYVLLVTGAGGWMFAYAFAKTKSLFAPFGLHFGWNIVAIVVLSSGPLGSQLLVPSGDPIELGGWPTLWFFLWQAFFVPGIVTWYISRKYSAPDVIPGDASSQ